MGLDSLNNCEVVNTFLGVVNPRQKCHPFAQKQSGQSGDATFNDRAVLALANRLAIKARCFQGADLR